MILACTGDNGADGIRFWDVTTGKLLKTIEVEPGAYSLAYSPDGRTLASTGYGEISFWDVATGKFLKTLKGHISAVNSVVFSSDGKTLASCSRDSTVILWDLTE
ncbi:MAG: hypothetical protein OXI43_16875 [Candidatus Poribacteria bacterium]|nr:hypothetical protein [Candidatus Poribacteria bacterium]